MIILSLLSKCFSAYSLTNLIAFSLNFSLLLLDYYLFHDIIKSKKRIRYEEKCNGKNIFNINDIKEITKEKNIKIGIITVQKESAQQVCDLLIECGIKAIWNFAPITLNVPEDVIIKNEDLSASLMILSKKLHERK